MDLDPRARVMPFLPLLSPFDFVLFTYRKVEQGAVICPLQVGAYLPLLTALFLSAFFRHGKSPLSCFRLREQFGSLPRSLCRLARQLARNGTARFGADSLRAEREQCVLRRERAIIKKEGVRFEHPRNRWTATYRFLPPFFFPPFFAILPP